MEILIIILLVTFIVSATGTMVIIVKRFDEVTETLVGFMERNSKEHYSQMDMLDELSEKTAPTGQDAVAWRTGSTQHRHHV